MNKIHSSLCLKSYNADIINGAKSQYTFSNVDLRNLLNPELYNNFDKFNLVLKSIITDSTANWGTADADKVATIQLKGLPLINCYDGTSKALNSNQVDITVFYFNNSIVQNYTNYNACSFRLNKNNPILNLTFQYNRVSDGTMCQGNFGNIVLLFDIIGCE